MIINLDDLNVLNVKIKLANGEAKEFNIREELAIDEGDLTQHFMEQPGKYAWWSAVTERLKLQRDLADQKLERAEARADKRVRVSLKEEGIKVTEAFVRTQIKEDEQYINALNEYNELNKNASTMEKVVKAFEHRKEMLISVGAHIRDGNGNSGEVRTKDTSKGSQSVADDLKARAKMITQREN